MLLAHRLHVILQRWRIHQSVNLACALQAVRLVMEHDAISEETMREGFARATWAGRFEIKKR